MAANQLPCLKYVTISPEFQFLSISAFWSNLVAPCIAYMLYEGPLPNIFLYITSSILLIAFMSLYFSILFLSIIILCPVCLCILCCALRPSIDCSVVQVPEAYGGIKKSSSFATLVSLWLCSAEKASSGGRWSSMISLFVMNAYLGRK